MSEEFCAHKEKRLSDTCLHFEYDGPKLNLIFKAVLPIFVFELSCLLAEMAAVKKVFSKIQQIVQVITKCNMLMLHRTTIFSKNLRLVSTWLQEVIMISVCGATLTHPGPGLLWKIHDATHKSTKQVSKDVSK